MAEELLEHECTELGMSQVTGVLTLLSQICPESRTSMFMCLRIKAIRQIVRTEVDWLNVLKRGRCCLRLGRHLQEEL